MSTLETSSKSTQEKAIDPVCGMAVDPEVTKLVSVYKDSKYWFCAEGCLKSFEADPEKYIKPKPAKKKGWFGRYFDRMAKANEKEFSCHGPSCH